MDIQPGYEDDLRQELFVKLIRVVEEYGLFGDNTEQSLDDVAQSVVLDEDLVLPQS